MSDVCSVKQSALTDIVRHNLIHKGDSVLVALSGGADSVTLLHVLLQLQDQLGIAAVCATHINHQLRGEESERDEAFVTELCKQFSVPLSIHRVNIASLAEQNKKGIEETGREERYRFFKEDAKKFSCSFIATAHTLSDNVETILMHMIRGCGLHGLCGIPPKRDTVIRPLLSCTREQIENYCRQNALSYVTDSTNRDDVYFRNAVRLHLIPQMKEHNANVEASIGRLIAHCAEDDAFLHSLAEKALVKARIEEKINQYRLSDLIDLPIPVLHRVIQLIFSQVSTQTVSEFHIQSFVGLLRNGGAGMFPENIRARVHKKTDTVFLFKANELKKQDDCVIDIDENCLYCNRMYRIERISLEEYENKLKVNKKLLKYVLDYDKIMGVIRFRGRKPGDSFRPSGRNVTKSLKKLFNEAGIAAEMRDEVPVLCDENGIIMVYGFGCDERVRINDETKQVLLVYEVTQTPDSRVKKRKDCETREYS